MPKQKTRVVIADDSPEFIEGLMVLFSTSDKYSVSETFSNGEELVNNLNPGTCDLVLTDIEMPIMNGIEAAKQINYKYPNLPLIAITMYKDKIYLDEIINAGFKGFIYKPELFEQLFITIENVLNNRFWFPSSGLKVKDDNNE